MGKESSITTEPQCLTPAEELDTHFVRSPGTEEIIQPNSKFIQLKALGCCIFPLLRLSISNDINANDKVISAVTQTSCGAEYYIYSGLRLTVPVYFTLVGHLL